MKSPLLKYLSATSNSIYAKFELQTPNSKHANCMNRRAIAYVPQTSMATVTRKVLLPYETPTPAFFNKLEKRVSLAKFEETRKGVGKG